MRNDGTGSLAAPTPAFPDGQEAHRPHIRLTHFRRPVVAQPLHLDGEVVGEHPLMLSRFTPSSHRPFRRQNRTMKSNLVTGFLHPGQGKANPRNVRHQPRQAACGAELCDIRIHPLQGIKEILMEKTQPVIPPNLPKIGETTVVHLAEECGWIVSTAT